MVRERNGCEPGSQLTVTAISRFSLTCCRAQPGELFCKILRRAERITCRIFCGFKLEWKTRTLWPDGVVSHGKHTIAHHPSAIGTGRNREVLLLLRVGNSDMRKVGYLFDSSSHYMLGVPGLVPGTADQAFVGRRFDSDSLLKQAIEQLAPGTGSATIEAESELVQVVRQMVRTDSTLVSPQQPA